MDNPSEPEPKPEPAQTALPIAVEGEAVGEWISTNALLEVLTSQGIASSERGLQDWAKKYQGTKPGFLPAYKSKKHKGKLWWFPLGDRQ